VVQTLWYYSCVGKGHNVVLVIQFSQHEPSTILSFIFLGSLLQAFTVVKKHNVVQVKITYGLHSSVSEKYTACIFRRLSEDGGSMRCALVGYYAV
jgi:hypothetical protein